MDVSIERILALKFLPIVDFESIINAEALLETMLEHSVPIFQVNFTNPQQLQQADVIGELTKKYPEMKIGAGFFYSSEDAEIAIKKGAQFVVSSVLAKDLPIVAAKYNVPAIISGFTPTEIYDAHKTQSDLVQIFPASQLHYKSIVSILEYLPDANFILTGGLTISSALEFLRFGAKAVALKGALFSKIDLLEENYQKIGNSIRNFRSRVQHN